MFELGQLLRKARLEKGISLDSLQETTKIRKRYLEAIEDGNFKILPGNFYVRAFIKSYAEAVGLDPAEVLKLYRSVVPESNPEQTAKPIRRKRTNMKSTERLNKWATNIMFWAFLLLVVGVAYYFVNLNYKGGGNEQQTTGDQTRHLTEKKSDEASPPNGSIPATDTTPTPSPAPTPTPTPTPTPGVKLINSDKGVDYYVSDGSPLTIQLTITGKECWVQVEKLGEKNERLEYGTLVTGDTRTFESTEPIFIILGAQNAVELKVNGTLLPVGDSANPRRFQLDLNS